MSKQKHNLPGKRFRQLPEWKRLCKAVITQYGTGCMCCGVVQKRKDVHIDHIKSRWFHPELALSYTNLQVLCIPCNESKGVKTRDYRPKTALFDPDRRRVKVKPQHQSHCRTLSEAEIQALGYKTTAG